jgi:ElaB/YqjD/DUF883 family membrane-anchored ribosome-binding protein
MSEGTTGSRKEQLLAEFNTIVTEIERLLRTLTHGRGTADAAAGTAGGKTDGAADNAAEGAADNAADGAESAGVASKLDENLKAARERLEQLEDLVLQRSKAAATVAAKATDTFVRANPWPAVGLAAGIGILIGLLLRRR